MTATGKWPPARGAWEAFNSKQIFMQLTGKNAEYADLILSKLMDNGGWISKDEILGILHDTYNYAAEPEFVLHDLVDNWKFIIVDGEILRLTKEGDKAAKKGVAQYCKGKEKKELFKDWKDYLSVGETLINIMVALASFFLGRCSSNWF